MESKSKDYTLTVIIPNYNKAEYISKCIGSILRQTLLPNEIIIVDDCSTDNSRDIIRQHEIENNLIKGIYLEQNVGVSRARNKGLSSSTSKYVTYIDSDDYYYSERKLQKEMELIKEYADKGKDILAYSIYVISDNAGTITSFPNKERKKCINGNALYALLARINIPSIPRDYCIRKDILLSAGAYSYPEDFYEDLDLLMRLAKAVSFQSTDVYGTAYRQTKGGLSKRPKEEHRIAINKIVNMYYSKLSQKDKIMVKMTRIRWGIINLVEKIVKHMDLVR